MTFSAGPKTGDHRLVEEKRIPSITDILIDQAGNWEDDESLESMNYIEIEVTDQYKTLATQLKVRNIDFYLKLTVARKFVVIRYYTIRLSRKKRSAWRGFAEHSIPYQHYDRVAHEHNYRYTTSHCWGSNGDKGSPSVIAPGQMNGRVEKYVEALRVPLRTYYTSIGGATKVSNHDKVEGWFRLLCSEYH